MRAVPVPGGRLGAASPAALAASAAAPSACAPIWGMAAACPAARAAAAAGDFTSRAAPPAMNRRRICSAAHSSPRAKARVRAIESRGRLSSGALLRTAPALARRSPPPTPPRSAGRPRPASAENPLRDLSTRSVLGPLCRANHVRGTLRGDARPCGRAGLSSVGSRSLVERAYGVEPVTKPQTVGMAPTGCDVGACQPIRSARETMIPSGPRT